MLSFLSAGAQQSVSLGWRGGASYIAGNSSSSLADPNFSESWASQCNLFVRYNLNSQWQLETGLFHARAKYNNTPANINTEAAQTSNYFQVPLMLNYYPSMESPCMKSCPILSRIQPYTGIGYVFTYMHNKASYTSSMGESGTSQRTVETNYTIPFTIRVQQGINVQLCHNWFVNAEASLNMGYRSVMVNGVKMNDARVIPGITAGVGVRL
jgi:outer membrane protein W